MIQHLCSTPPSVQAATLEKYFTPSAQFNHPFCRTLNTPNSRYQVARIYRWYKIMSPRVSAKVHSVSFDRTNNILYVGISQVFAIWAVPIHRADVSLVTVLHLVQEIEPASGKGKWYIQSQNDLYQTDQFIRFALPHFAWVFVLWQYFATLVCVVASYIFAPVTWWEETQQVQFTRDERPPVWNDGK